MELSEREQIEARALKRRLSRSMAGANGAGAESVLAVIRKERPSIAALEGVACMLAPQIRTGAPASVSSMAAAVAYAISSSRGGTPRDCAMRHVWRMTIEGLPENPGSVEARKWTAAAIADLQALGDSAGSPLAFPDAAGEEVPEPAPDHTVLMVERFADVKFSADNRACMVELQANGGQTLRLQFAPGVIAPALLMALSEALQTTGPEAGEVPAEARAAIVDGIEAGCPEDGSLVHFAVTGGGRRFMFAATPDAASDLGAALSENAEQAKARRARGN